MYQKVFEFHAELLKALAHPKRLEILHLLRDQSINVSQMQEMLGLPQANLSQHLMILREAKVVTAEKQGKEVRYRVTHKNFIKASDLMRMILIERNKEMADELAMKMIDLVPIVKDLVCGMRVSPRTASHAYLHKGNEYYFCAAGCLEQFKINPEQYIKNS